MPQIMGVVASVPTLRGDAVKSTDQMLNVVWVNG